MTIVGRAGARMNGELVFNDLPSPAIERIRLKLSLPNPKYVNLKRFNRFVGAEPERVECLIEMPDGSVHVPRGCTTLLKEQLLKYDLVPRVAVDEATDGQKLTRRSVDLVLALRDYQKEAIAKLKAKGQGLVVLPCGTGKTKLGVGAVLDLDRTTLILVHTTDLADQWLEDLRAFGLDVGLLGAGLSEIHRDVVVGIVDSVVPYLEHDPAWGKRFGFVIVDEAHHAPAITFQRALRLCPARYRLGLTATPEREDGLDRLVEWSFGDVLLERTTREMIKMGYLMPAAIEILSTGWTWSYDGPEKKRLVTLEKDVSEDLGRNMLIADRVGEEAKRGETCLVLVRTRAHTKELAELIHVRSGVEARAVTGLTGKKKRKGAIADLRGGTLPVMVATSLADEGLDLPRLSVIALAAPQRARGATIQRLGRLLRLWSGKKPKLLDFVDDDVPTLADRASARRKVYREAGLLRDSV